MPWGDEWLLQPAMPKAAVATTAARIILFM
jgi:hypothetical protein